jgi:hypothetical protein
LQKTLGRQIANPQIKHLKITKNYNRKAEGAQIYQIIYFHKFADLRFAELICGAATFAC